MSLCFWEGERLEALGLPFDFFLHGSLDLMGKAGVHRLGLVGYIPQILRHTPQDRDER